MISYVAHLFSRKNKSLLTKRDSSGIAIRCECFVADGMDGQEGLTWLTGGGSATILGGQRGEVGWGQGEENSPLVLRRTGPFAKKSIQTVLRDITLHC